MRRADAPRASGPAVVGSDVAVRPTKIPGVHVVDADQPVAVAGSDAGVLDVLLRDQHDRGPQGVTVAATGPVTASAVSDANGHARFEIPAGTYRLSVPVGCAGAVHTTKGATGRAGVAAGRLSHGELTVEWRARYAPDWPVHASFIPDFPLGQAVDVRFDVHDRCTIERAPNATYPTFVFEPSANVRVADAPKLRADRDGWGYLRFTCIKEGPVSLYSVDRRNEDDRLELLSNASARTPVCKRLSP